MPTIAYLSNLFPSPVEPYVVDEICELRRRGVTVVSCSARKVRDGLGETLQPFARGTLYIQSLRIRALLSAMWLCVLKSPALGGFLRHVLFDGRESLKRRVFALPQTLLGVYYAAMLRDRHVEHIHVHHGYFGSWIAMVAARLLNVGFSMTLHGSDLLEKILVRRLGVDDPVSKRISPAEPSSVFSILTVGRLHPVKNHAFLVQACWLLKCRGLRFVCRIAGEGPERQSLEAMIRDFDIRAEVRLLGQLSRDQLDEQYAQADLVLLTSRSEGIPLVLMEAMVRGKPVLAPAITGIPELVADGKTGFLYQAGSLDDFMSRVVFVMNMQPTLGPLLQAAREHVLKTFNRETNLAAVCELFTPCLITRSIHASDTLPESAGTPHEDSFLQQIQLPLQRY